MPDTSSPSILMRQSVLICVILSVCVHVLAGLGFEFRDGWNAGREKLVLVDLLPRPVTPQPVPVAHEAQSGQPRTEDNARKAVKAPRVKTHAASIQKKRPPVTTPALANMDAVSPDPVDDTIPSIEVGETVTSDSSNASKPIILANESGQDMLKHGAEARFMHGVATEEFVEDNYVGEYTLGTAGRVWIEDDRVGSGHLILHAEGMGLRRYLYRFNRFIYIYGETLDSPDPMSGTVTFFSDGYHIHQFLWQHNAVQAFFPRRAQ